MNQAARLSNPDSATMVSLDYADLLQGRIDRASFVAQVRRALDEEGMVALRSFVTPEQRELYAADFMRGSAQIKASPGGGKYSLKYGDIAGHDLVRRASSEELLSLVSAIAVVPPALCEPLATEDVQVGYSITRARGDFVGFHFDGLCVMNILVPIVLPESISEEPATLAVWPNLLDSGESFRNRVIGKIGRLLASKPFIGALPLRQYIYRAGEALLFYGSRTLHGVFPRRTDGIRAVASINYRWRR